VLRQIVIVGLIVRLLLTAEVESQWHIDLLITCYWRSAGAWCCIQVSVY